MNGQNALVDLGRRSLARCRRDAALGPLSGRRDAVKRSLLVRLGRLPGVSTRSLATLRKEERRFFSRGVALSTGAHCIDDDQRMGSL